MNTKELRLKNYIKVNGELQEVVELPLPDNCVRKNTKGIQISEKWLSELGFNNNHIIIKHLYFEWLRKNNLVIKGMLGAIKPIECQYVHQLQNLCLDLTGEELTKFSKSSKIKK